MMRGQCPQCGKVFWIEYPDLWAYKRNGRYMCSWGCLRKHDGKEANGMEKQKTILTEDQKRKAVDMALEGQSPIRYLRELGCKNPYTSWKSIRGWARNEYSAEECARLPEGFRSERGERAAKEKAAKEQAKEPEEEPGIELVYDPSIAEEYRAEQARKAEEEARKEQEEAAERIMKMAKERKPLNIINGYKLQDVTVTAIRTELGEYYFDRKYRTIDWRNEEGDEVSMDPSDWRKLADEIPMMMQALGAE